MAVETWWCPDTKRVADDVVGCGAQFEAEADEHGWVDCPECGIMFDREGEKP